MFRVIKEVNGEINYLNPKNYENIDMAARQI